MQNKRKDPEYLANFKYYPLPTVSQEGIEEFRKLYKKKFGVELSGEDAVDLAQKMLLLLYIGTETPP